MHTVPATNGSSANVLSPGPSSPPQVSDKGSPASTSSTFQDVYRNVAATENGKSADQAPGNVPVKKKSSDQDTGNATSASPTSANNAVPANSKLTLSTSFALTPQLVAGQPEATSSPSASSAESSPDPLSGASVSEKAATDRGSGASLVLSNSLLASNVQSSGPDPNGTVQKNPGKNGQQTASQADGVAPLPVQAVLGSANASAKFNALENSGSSDPATAQQKQAVVTNSLVTPQGSIASSGSGTATTLPAANSDPNTATSNEFPAVNTAPARSLPLSADSLAFTLQLANTGGSSKAYFDSLTATNPPSPEGHTTADASSTTSAQPITAALAQSALAAQPVLPSAPAATNPASSRTQVDIASSSGASRIQSSNDSGPRQDQDSTKSGSSQRDSDDSAKQDTNAHAQLAANAQESTSGPPSNGVSNTLRQATPPTTSWLNGTAESGVRPILNAADQPTPLRTPLAASIQEIHVLPAESPKTSGTSEILLQVGDGQSSAAVRVVDRAGAVNISVHAADQDLRTSLRANLNDLSAQLNAQGLKTEPVKTAAQSSPQGRSDQGPQDHRSGGQQHSAPQGDRQSPRGQRASALWLSELQEQTIAANPGGNNS